MDLLLLSLGPQEYGKSLPESSPGFCTPEGDIFRDLRDMEKERVILSLLSSKDLRDVDCSSRDKEPSELIAAACLIPPILFSKCGHQHI